MDDLTGICLGKDGRYCLQSLVARSGLTFVYKALDRLEESSKLVEIWNVELTTDQEDFLERLQQVMQIQDNRLLPVLDGGIWVLPTGSEMLKEVPYVVTPELPPSVSPSSELPLDIALRLAVKLVAAVHYLHSGAYVRSRSGQIIGQVKLSHGKLTPQSVWLDPDSNKLILRDWYHFWLLEGRYYPAQDVQDLSSLLPHFLPSSHRLFKPIWSKSYATAKEIETDLRQCQLKLQPKRRNWYLLLPLGALPVSFLLLRRPSPPPTPITTNIDPPPVEVPPAPRLAAKSPPVPPPPPREPQVYRIDFPTAPSPPPPPEPVIPRATRPAAPPPPPPPSPPTPPVTAPRVEIKPPPVPLVPPTMDSEPVKEIETTIDANFAPSHTQLLQQAGERALVTIAGEFTNPNRQEVSMLVLAARKGRIAPIFSARVTREQWEADPTGTSWANYMSRSSTLLGFGASASSTPGRMTPRRALTPSIQPLPSNPMQEAIEQTIQDRK